MLLQILHMVVHRGPTISRERSSTAVCSLLSSIIRNGNENNKLQYKLQQPAPPTTKYGGISNEGDYAPLLSSSKDTDTSTALLVTSRERETDWSSVQGLGKTSWSIFIVFSLLATNSINLQQLLANKPTNCSINCPK